VRPRKTPRSFGVKSPASFTGFASGIRSSNGDAP
jgi:hypothetical protein